jgi:hypothetical protein
LIYKLGRKGGQILHEIIILVLEIILLILKGFNPTEATRATSEKYGVAFSKLWNALPVRWK